MAGSTFVDLTDDAPLKKAYIDLTANGAEGTSNSVMKKTSRLKGDPSDGLSILDNPPSTKENSNPRLRFAFKSSSGKNQPLTPKSNFASKVGKDKTHLNGTRRNVNGDVVAPTMQLPKAQPEEALQNSDRLSPERSDDKRAQIPETPPRINPPESTVSGELETRQKLELDDQAFAVKKDILETLTKFETIRYDFASLEASLDAYKASLQKILANVYNKHRLHVQVGALTLKALFWLSQG